MKKINRVGDPLTNDSYETFVDQVRENFDELFNVKRYNSFLTQTSTNAPVATVLRNEIGTSTWTYEDVGTFLVTTAGQYTSGKTSPFKAVGYDIDGNKITAEWVDVNSIRVKTYATADTSVLANGVLSNQEFNIFVYGNI